MEKPLGFTHWIGYSISRERIVLINGKRYYYSVYVDTIDCDRYLERRMAIIAIVFSTSPLR